MNSSYKLASIVALALSAGLAGCMAQPENTDENAPAEDEVAAAPAEQAAKATGEKTGVAAEKCGGGFGFGGFGGCGVGLPFNGLGGCGWGPGFLFGGFPTPASVTLSALAAFPFGEFPFNTCVGYCGGGFGLGGFGGCW